MTTVSATDPDEGANGQFRYSIESGDPDDQFAVDGKNASSTVQINGGEGYSQKDWVGLCGLLSKPLTLFKTKICDFLYPIHDLAKDSIPYLRPDAKSIPYFRPAI